MINRQHGLALSALIIWGIVIALVAITALKVVPEVIEYYKIRQVVKKVASESMGRTVPEVRQAYSKYAEVEHIKTIGPADLNIFKEDNQVVIAFAYERRIPLVANVSLLIDFKASSSGRGYGP
ncbi:DUF4845 domain-containing protein [Accumulibacter sp.]|uniref:DUF4845 domain-containing protein n=1 Tax=Accumulibacter sp. TaxID=2053492 RepID=UPI0025D445FD|nr:DUF4845 domain-containing protein [Accumulibacter sp.]MCM8594450.1 DUF4845 domain-containing protein [Accumulibacter sp.]MCM8624914.1 DUF4845 domain-containing protein [Accumulibacter sp.]MDS4048596.1 DUF4845 domain-containing protein [Accumulibacter sp.]